MERQQKGFLGLCANGNEEYFYDSYKAKIDEIERKKP